MNARAHYRMKSAHLGRTAFSLIEMLVVMAIIAVGVALMIPVLSKGRSKATAIRCVNQLRSSGLAINGIIVDGRGSWRTFAEGAPETNQWARRIAAYGGGISQRETMRCPSGTVSFAATHTAWAWQTYGLNLSDQKAGALSKEESETNYTLYLPRVEEAARHVLLADSATTASGIPLQSFRLYHIERYFAGVYAWHDRRANLFFLDGHIETVPVESLGEYGVPYHDKNGSFRLPTPQRL